MNFIEFFWILFRFFRYFSKLFPYKKSQKVLYFSRGTHEADVTQRAHVAEPRKATWTHGHVDAYVDAWTEVG